MVERPTRAISAMWTRISQMMRLYQEELLISHMQSGHKRTHSWLSSSPMSSMTHVLSTLPFCHAQDASAPPSLTQKCCHNPIHCILTQKYPTGKRNRCLFLSERKVFPGSPAQTSPKVPLSRTGSHDHSLFPFTGEPGIQVSGISSF